MHNPSWENISNWKKEYPKGCQLEAALNICSKKKSLEYINGFCSLIVKNVTSYHIHIANNFNYHNGKYIIHIGPQPGLHLILTKNNLKRLHESISNLLDKEDKIEVEHWAIEYFYHIARLMNLSVHRINPKDARSSICTFTRNKDVIFLLWAWKNGNIKHFPKDMIRYIAKILNPS